ncbi:DUF2167 domain-containing protein [Sphingomonas colocasiae]|uniref:DUF2167 domain-containing protein n=1 Tax=Sphingomonas colocasiae TaxID=1848973 RepID=A0ABS7PXU3_9SPHN|nr:DUF2167 domain-containing protein [Sphingomonas colocasiae]MBY8825799.1 DUF2167 domain-containing protein [Sphingomonas colocasiae]
MLKSFVAFGLVAAAPALFAAPPAPTEGAAANAAGARFKALLESLHPVDGQIRIPQAQAALALGKDYYFLPADEAKRVLTEGWGNPPSSVTDVLGMVFPAGKTFVDAPWGAVVTFEKTGYVSDSDAQTADYDAVLTQSRENEEALNEERRKAGFGGQHLVGWAQPPSYDGAQHALIWAREIKFDGETDNMLNYDVRLLGRRGVLSLNMVAGMLQLAQVRTAAASFGKAATFESGARYADFDESVDEKAEYGLAGLVAAGVGVAAAKKLGLLGLLLAFGKKFIVLIVAAIGGLVSWFRRRRNGDEAEI